MPAGLQVWGSDGRLILDGTHRIGRFKGAAYLNGNPGSVPVDMSDGTPFWSMAPEGFFFHISNETVPPIISIGPTGVSWTYSSTAGLSYPAYVKGWLFFGVF